MKSLSIIKRLEELERAARNRNKSACNLTLKELFESGALEKLFDCEVVEREDIENVLKDDFDKKS